MSSKLFRKLSFGIQKTKKSKLRPQEETRLEISRISQENLEKYDEFREKTIGKIEKKSQKKGKNFEQKENEDVGSPEEARKNLEKLLGEIRRANRIFTWGENIPDIILRFGAEEGFEKSIIEKLKEANIEKPSPIQMQSIPLMMKRRNVLSSAPTGSGKTLAFALPVIDEILKLKNRSESAKNKLLAIILEPTRELANQTFSEFQKYSNGEIECCNFSGEDEEFEKAEILISTPNRIVFHLEKLDLSHLRWLVVDESDRLFEVVEGNEKCFRNQLAAIYKACEAKCTRTAFFSATFSQEVEKWCKENIDNIGMVCVGERNSSNTHVKQELKYCGTEDGKKVAIKLLLKTQFKPPALVFVQSKDRAAQLVKLLSAIDGSLKVDSINSDKSDKERDETMQRFRNGEIWVLVCTELLGRGLDLSDVGLVINYDLPTSIVSYIHRVGRTGRAGNRGNAVTYFTDSDIQYVKSIAMVIRQSGFEVPQYLLEMKKVSRDKRKDLLKRAPKRHKIAVVKKVAKKKKMKKTVRTNE
ncbi:unnamed protein product [Caenorhabditis angaria]|uniref:ATP-dependent RNA helicase n=1 Tax=Caenorhabditis angaria TaxID=860376 RepID=A0A9P1I6M6_9PELO|nr:unnamed protein product [Caenorhabditis angaria]